MKYKTLVLGASSKPDRYSNIAVNRLSNNGHEVVAIGRSAGQINGIDIRTGQPQLDDVHTITLYLRPEYQKEQYDYILSLAPKRIIFNPGTENPELIRLAKERGIETEVACTLVMLAADTY